jgi:hypothetical protein
VYEKYILPELITALHRECAAFVCGMHGWCRGAHLLPHLPRWHSGCSYHLRCTLNNTPLTHFYALIGSRGRGERRHRAHTLRSRWPPLRTLLGWPGRALITCMRPRPCSAVLCQSIMALVPSLARASGARALTEHAISLAGGGVAAWMSSARVWQAQQR